MDFGTEEKMFKMPDYLLYKSKNFRQASKSSNNFYWHQYQYKSKWNVDSTSYFHSAIWFYIDYNYIVKYKDYKTCCFWEIHTFSFYPDWFTRNQSDQTDSAVKPV